MDAEVDLEAEVDVEVGFTTTEGLGVLKAPVDEF